MYRGYFDRRPSCSLFSPALRVQRELQVANGQTEHTKAPLLLALVLKYGYLYSDSLFLDLLIKAQRQMHFVCDLVIPGKDSWKTQYP